MKNSELVAEDELHAYVDGLLSADDRARVEIYLNAHPKERKRVDAFMQQNILLHRLFDWHLGQPDDRAFEGVVERFAWLERRLARWGTFLGAAAVVSAIVGASGVGWFSYSWFGNQDIARTEFIEQAAEAHTLASELAPRGLLFTTTGPDESDIFKWITTHHKIMLRRAPDFSGLGFSLVGARVLPTGSGPAVDLLYADVKSQQRVTLFIGRGWSNGDNAPQIMESDALKMFYREDRGVAYGLIGNVKGPTLIDMARIVSAMLDDIARFLSPIKADSTPVGSAKASLARDGGVSSVKSATENWFLRAPSSQAASGISLQTSPR